MEAIMPFLLQHKEQVAIYASHSLITLLAGHSWIKAVLLLAAVFAIHIGYKVLSEDPEKKGKVVKTLKEKAKKYATKYVYRHLVAGAVAYAHSHLSTNTEGPNRLLLGAAMVAVNAITGYISQQRTVIEEEKKE